MYTENDIGAMLPQLGAERGGLLMIHCSDRAAENMQGGTAGLIDALCGYMSDGALIVPANQPDTADTSVPFDPADAPVSDSLADALLRIPGTIRTLHPSRSLAVSGKQAAWFARDEHLCTTPYPRSGCMGKLLDHGGKLLFIDTDLSRCAFLHAIEEWGGIEDRIGEQHMQYIIMHDGSLFMGTASELTPAAIAAEEFYPKVEKTLISLKAAIEYDLDGIRCLMCDCAAMVRIVSELLILEPTLFDDNKAVNRSFIKSIRAGLKE